MHLELLELSGSCIILLLYFSVLLKGVLLCSYDGSDLIFKLVLEHMGIASNCLFTNSEMRTWTVILLLCGTFSDCGATISRKVKASLNAMPLK